MQRAALLGYSVTQPRGIAATRSPSGRRYRNCTTPGAAQVEVGRQQIATAFYVVGGRPFEADKITFNSDTEGPDIRFEQNAAVPEKRGPVHNNAALDSLGRA